MGHLTDNNENYLSHFRFAANAGVNFVISGLLFLVHAFLPFVPIYDKFNLDAMHEKVSRWSEYASQRIHK